MTRARALTPTQRKYVLDAARGLTCQQSADLHWVSVETVRSTLKNARESLGARTIAHAVALAFEHGDITTDDVRAPARASDHHRR